MNKIITALFLAGMILACKPKSEDIEPIVEVKCKKLSYRKIDYQNVVVESETYVYDKTGKLIELQRLHQTTKHEYDAKGNLLKTSEYGKNLISGVVNLWSVTEYTYNAANQLIRQVINNVIADSVLKKGLEVLHEYHANGKRKKTITFYSGSTVPDVIAEYNEKGNQISIEYKGESYSTSEYNAADLVVKSTTYYTASNLKTEYLYEYDSQNRDIKVTEFNNGVLRSYITREYNDKGKLIADIRYRGDGTIYMKTITEFNGDNYKISWSSQLINQIGYTTGYTIGEAQNGLIVKTSNYQDNELLDYTLYAYDSHKNVIKQELFLGNATRMYSHQEWTYQCD